MTATEHPYNPYEVAFNHDAPCRLDDLSEQATLAQLQEIERMADDTRKELHE